MALTAASFNATVSWQDLATPVTGAHTIKNNDTLSLTNSPAVATYNRRLRKQYSLAAAGTQLIDLASFTDPYTGATITLTKAIAMLLTGTQAFRIEPNSAANPLPWFFGIAANYLTFGANEGFAALKAVTFTTGSKLLLTNQGGSTGTFDLVIIGGD